MRTGFCGDTSTHREAGPKREDTIQMNLSEVQWDEVEWINLAEGADSVGLL